MSRHAGGGHTRDTRWLRSGCTIGYQEVDLLYDTFSHAVSSFFFCSYYIVVSLLLEWRKMILSSLSRFEDLMTSQEKSFYCGGWDLEDFRVYSHGLCSSVTTNRNLVDLPDEE